MQTRVLELYTNRKSTRTPQITLPTRLVISLFNSTMIQTCEYGSYENKFMACVLNPDIEAVIQDNPQLIPFGIIGPPRFKARLHPVRTLFERQTPTTA